MYMYSLFISDETALTMHYIVDDLRTNPIRIQKEKTRRQRKERFNTYLFHHQGFPPR